MGDDELIAELRKAEAIVRAVAAKEPIGFDGWGQDLICGLCDGGSPGHEKTCPWRLSVEWVAEHPA